MYKRYKNRYQKKIKRSFFHYLLWFFRFYKDPITTVPKKFVYPNPKEEIVGDYHLTWINHSTFLIQAGNLTFITDPIFNKRCSPFSSIGPKRHHPPALLLQELPLIDIVLISHNHYDHLEKESVRLIYQKNPHVRWVVPLGVKHWLQKTVRGIKEENMIELAWDQTHHFVDFSCTAVPAQHFSGRGLFDHNSSLWMGIIIDVQGKRFYFAGDTGYNEVDFKEIGRRYSGIELSLLPIGAYKPRDFMRAVHINPEEAVMIHEEVGSLLSVGGHWKTFHLSDEGEESPPYDLFCALMKKGIPPEQFRILEPGQRIAW